jgi:hypothetical protein
MPWQLDQRDDAVKRQSVFCIVGGRCMRKASWILAILALSCAAQKMPLTAAARGVKIILRTKESAVTERIYEIKARCKAVGGFESDDRNEVLNEAGAAGANTVILQKGDLYQKDWNGSFYRCEQPKP